MYSHIKLPNAIEGRVLTLGISPLEYPFLTSDFIITRRKAHAKRTTLVDYSPPL